MAPPSTRTAAPRPRPGAGAPFRRGPRRLAPALLLLALLAGAMTVQGFLLKPLPSLHSSSHRLLLQLPYPSSPLPTALPEPTGTDAAADAAGFTTPTPAQHAVHQAQHDGGLLDSHWLEGDVVAQLRAGSGEIPPFTWPHCDTADVATGRGIAPVDREALRAARARLRSVPAVWTALAAACPDNPMLVDPAHGVPGRTGGLVLSFGHVDALVQQAAAGLHALGLRKGDHVAVFGENSAR